MPILVHFTHKQQLLKPAFVINFSRKKFGFPYLKTTLYQKLSISDRVQILFMKRVENGEMEELEPEEWEDLKFTKDQEVVVVLGVDDMATFPILPTNPKTVNLRNRKAFHEQLDVIKYKIGERLSAKDPNQSRIDCFLSSSFNLDFCESDIEEIPGPVTRSKNNVDCCCQTNDEDVEDETENYQEMLEEEYVRSKGLGRPRRLPKLTAEQISEQNALKQLNLMQIIENSKDSVYLLHAMKQKWNDDRFYLALSGCLATLIFTRTRTLRTKTQVYDVIADYLEEHPHLDIRCLLGPISSRLCTRLYYMRTNIAHT
ncbi:unnamed protein product [Bursaphelenchus xylophilus]|uniref:(pine wood nematode) hypothetical protein n=1 Tax=Bursaphelenchus xylophilus TaxID=6326 RepID=A0A1I7S281_BURXY|nr:unnamed protein product [Bursaphelenchus xylophilus]CAG9114820.1 unnamed protein product [Bursaphelenchus xylophilus]